MGDLSNQQDADLLAAIARRDKAAFAELFGRYAVRIKAFLMRGGAAEGDADDLSQEVMIAIWHKASLFDPAKAAVSTWIFTIARNRRIDLIRRNSRPEPDPEDPLFQPDPEPAGIDAVHAQHVAREVGQALAVLPAEQREILRLAFYDGLTHGEISAHLDIPLGTVKSRIRLAFKAMRAQVGDDMAEAILDG